MLSICSNLKITGTYVKIFKSKTCFVSKFPQFENFRISSLKIMSSEKEPWLKKMCLSFQINESSMDIVFLKVHPFSLATQQEKVHIGFHKISHTYNIMCREFAVNQFIPKVWTIHLWEFSGKNNIVYCTPKVILAYTARCCGTHVLCFSRGVLCVIVI